MSTSKAAPPDRFIVLLRHGIAEDASPDKKDEDRSLTAEGHARMKQIARGLERVLPKAYAVYSSPLLRAVQTALWVSKAYRSRVAVNTTDALAPSATKKDFAALLEAIQEQRVVLVGHEPNLSDNLRAVLGLGRTQSVELKKGGCYGIRVHADGSAVLEWMLPPRILRKL
ncbi:MAG TPA: histidine phosphatase family protein [Thermoanaerobaculia bacterium]|nr:histidine phosphatase family protein [Thermoanaerobaculia bacterium]